MHHAPLPSRLLPFLQTTPLLPVHYLTMSGNNHSSKQTRAPHYTSSASNGDKAKGDVAPFKGTASTRAPLIANIGSGGTGRHPFSSYSTAAQAPPKRPRLSSTCVFTCLGPPIEPCVNHSNKKCPCVLQCIRIIEAYELKIMYVSILRCREEDEPPKQREEKLVPLSSSGDKNGKAVKAETAQTILPPSTTQATLPPLPPPAPQPISAPPRPPPPDSPAVPPPGYTQHHWHPPPSHYGGYQWVPVPVGGPPPPAQPQYSAQQPPAGAPPGPPGGYYYPPYPGMWAAPPPPVATPAVQQPSAQPNSPKGKKECVVSLTNQQEHNFEQNSNEWRIGAHYPVFFVVSPVFVSNSCPRYQPKLASLHGASQLGNFLNITSLSL